MTRTVRIYQVYDDCDAAATDGFYCTEKEAEDAARDMVDPQIIPLDVEMTKRGICRELTHTPIR